MDPIVEEHLEDVEIDEVKVIDPSSLHPILNSGWCEKELTVMARPLGLGHPNLKMRILCSLLLSVTHALVCSQVLAPLFLSWMVPTARTCEVCETTAARHTR